MVRPVKDPDKWAPPHDGFTVVGVVHLFNEIAAIEEALMSAIENVRAISTFHPSESEYLD